MIMHVNGNYIREAKNLKKIYDHPSSPKTATAHTHTLTHTQHYYKPLGIQISEPAVAVDKAYLITKRPSI